MATRSINLFNTETRQKEPLKVQKEGQVTMYTCGPTVYNFAHIGNFRTYVFEDLLRRTLKYFGYKVTQAMNITDVDDKTIKGALAQNVTLKEYTRPFEEAFFKDIDTLNIERVEYYPAATDYIQEMIAMIQQLIDKKMAYVGADGSVYFPIMKFERYGCLSHLHLDELVTGASQRVSEDEYDKENAADFVLWKKWDESRDGNIFWESPFGRGRPGWHLECSAMAMRLLGDTLDIHVGGIDNMFPHHENEIAQSESCSGKRFVNHWLHAEHLLVDHKKMSKKLGNFYTLRDLLEKGFSGVEVRYMLLQTHYKTQLNFTMAGMEGARSALQRLNAFTTRLKALRQTAINGNGASKVMQELLDKAYKQFDDALADDLNISVALAALFDLVREGNVLCDKGSMNGGDAIALLDMLQHWDTVLGVLRLSNEEEPIPAAVSEALKMRDAARGRKDWKEADAMRALISSHGYVVEDTPQGSRLKKVEQQ